MLKKMTFLFCILGMFSAFSFEVKKNSYNRVATSIENLQSCYWIMSDLLNQEQLVFKQKESRELFEDIVTKMNTTVTTIKKHLVSSDSIDLGLLSSETHITNESFIIIKQLIFLNEIKYTTAISDLKFEQARHRLMLSIINLREYIENGDDEIYTAINQRNSALAAIKMNVPEEWDNDITSVLPKYLSQTDYHYVKSLINQTPPGSISRYMKAYFSNHSDKPIQDNYKGQVASNILKYASGWIVDSLVILPDFVSKKEFEDAMAIFNTSERYEIAPSLKKLFND